MRLRLVEMAHLWVAEEVVEMARPEELEAQQVQLRVFLRWAVPHMPAAWLGRMEQTASFEVFHIQTEMLRQPAELVALPQPLLVAETQAALLSREGRVSPVLPGASGAPPPPAL